MTNTVDPTSGLGQIELLRRLEGVANKAVATVAPGRAMSLTLLNQSENTTYLVTDQASGETRILRIHRTGYHTPAAIASEHAWMAALKTDTRVHTPDVIPGPDGARIHHVATDAVPDGRVCVFFEHLAGEEPDPDNLLPSMPNLGAVTARMHRHVEGWALPPGFERFSWNCETILGETPHWGHWYDGPNLNAEVTGANPDTSSKLSPSCWDIRSMAPHAMWKRTSGMNSWGVRSTSSRPAWAAVTPPFA